MLNYKEMTVNELREESRKKGLPLQKNGHKFVKDELIQRLESFDRTEDLDGEAVKEGKKEPETKKEEVGEKHVESWEREEDQAILKERYEEKNSIKFATNFTEIVKKYSGRKPKRIYDEMVKGDFVLFVHYVDSRDGNVYKVLRVARTIAIDRKSEKLLVETRYKTRVEVVFEDILFVKREDGRFPRDIREYFIKKKEYIEQKKESEKRS